MVYFLQTCNKSFGLYVSIKFYSLGFHALKNFTISRSFFKTAFKYWSFQGHSIEHFREGGSYVTKNAHII